MTSKPRSASVEAVHVLVLGHSSICERRVIPALAKLDACARLDVASRRGASVVPADTAKVDRLFGDYARAIDESHASVVYVSTANHEHAEWVRAALLRGKHVVVDKPATLDSRVTSELVALAAARGLCLAESVVFEHHPQVAALQALFDEANPAMRAVAIFSMPPLPATSFRYRAEHGGGALWDLGPYAIGAGRAVFGVSAPLRIEASIGTRSQDGAVDTSFSVLFTYPGGRSLVGHFGFDGEYQNSLFVLGRDGSAQLERVFTTAPDASGEIRARAKNQQRLVAVAAADTFAIFFERVFASLTAGDFARWGRAAEESARVLDALRSRALVGEAEVR